ncbi:MAG: hypothetical protein IJP62_05795, partial [Treponema sp.]|nr:hypothetical protein [Treponema sp.]
FFRNFLTSLGPSQKGLTRTIIWFVIQFSRFLAVNRRLDYNSTFIFICQYLFSKKSKVFLGSLPLILSITAKAWKNAEKRGLRLSLNSGISINRLVMLLTGVVLIRDILQFYIQCKTNRLPTFFLTTSLFLRSSLSGI